MEKISENINREDMLELTRRMTPARTSFTRIAGCYVDQEACRNCKLCIGTGCPALYAKDGKVHIDQDACNGCGVCMQVCPFDAIKMADGKAGAKA